MVTPSPRPLAQEAESSRLTCCPEQPETEDQRVAEGTWGGEWGDTGTMVGPDLLDQQWDLLPGLRLLGTE